MMAQDLVLEADAGRDSAAAKAIPVEQARMGDMVLSLAGRMEDLEPAWRRMQALPRNSLHQGYDWCKAWFDSAGSELALVEGRIGGRTVMILPLDIHRRAGLSIAYPPAHGYNNFNSGLFAQDFQLTAQEQAQFSRKLGRCLSGCADLVVIDAVPLVWRGLRHPFADLATVPHPNNSFQLPILDTFERTLSQLNAKRRRKKFRIQTRRMEEAGGFDHYIPRTRDESHALLEVFFAQKRRRFEAHGLPDAFGRPAVRAFYHALLDAPANGSDQPLFLHALRLSGDAEKPVVAVSGMSRKGDHLICQFGSIDAVRVPDASPGELLYWLMIEQAGAQGISLFDFGVGDQGYKRSWCPVETELSDILIPLTARGRLAARLHAGVVRLKGRVKRSPMLYRLLQRLRAGKGRADSEA
ncbi:CelD/BcsL family acetyltransferase involved in cellulose biosynthesis [Neorhizobium galegae]|uniref:GNAT family N-acetyltransferase n=1 Tax=Neorhizobium galegae TaxID=399 RepID=UPI001AEA7CA7|nr:GNAT family N-acetyltransferase [Neorhizobium galegae]MBP2547284.1 CelD/BcsL family acetyltransferase involved in cellulose biosynthesis [Neorhizobium galegae]